MATTQPFTNFNFAVEVVRAGGSAPLVQAAFAECDGLEMGMEFKTIRVGGSNDRQVRLAGPVTLGQLTLKRGMAADSFDLWQWMSDSIADPALRAEASVWCSTSARRCRCRPWSCCSWGPAPRSTSGCRRRMRRP